MICPICGSAMVAAFTATVLTKYDASFLECQGCGFVSAEDPVWLAEAHSDPLNRYDTGLVDRNLLMARRTAAVLFFLFDRRGIFLDIGGGCGLFVRLMRDVGFDFRWSDPMATNILARGFEYDEGLLPIELATAFEVFEHLPDPVALAERIFTMTGSLLLSTQMLPHPRPAPNDWWYYGFEHGQHVSFYSRRSLSALAGRFGCRLLSNGGDFHLITRRTTREAIFRGVLGISRWGGSAFVRQRMKGRAQSDMHLLLDRFRVG